MTMTSKVFSNRYEILRPIARGGMAEVFLAQDQLLDRQVALKVLFAEFARDPSFVERFRREAQAAANLNHPDIVAIYDWGHQDDTYFMVMEYVEGRPIRDIIRSEGLLPPMRAAEIAAAIAGALAFAHRNGVVHRDVKPGNVLITDQGHVKVTDFGIARAGTSEALTQTGAVMGTATYFSPEQAQGLAVDGRSDVYSLGVVLYEMLCGVPPFTGDSPVSVAYKHVRETPTAPSRRVQGVPHDLEQIILTALEKSPRDRYQSADEMRADLLRFTRGRPLAPRPVAALVADVPTGPLPTAGQPTTATPALDLDHRNPRKSERQRSSGRSSSTIAVIAVAVILIGAIVALVVTQISGSSTGTALVPNVSIDKPTFEEAKAELEARGFTVTRTNAVNDSVEEGLVFAQDPASGTKLKKGGDVMLRVSMGAGETTVPQIVGLTAADAKIALEKRGLEVALPLKTIESDNPPGRVFATDPEVGTTVKKGKKITLTFTVAGILKVPSLVGMDPLEASNELGGAGFTVAGQREEPSDTVPKGRVIRTDPPADAEAEKDTPITIFVSTGPDAAPLPSLIGQTEASARQLLTSAGFLNVQVTYTPSTSADAGRVISQVPDANVLYKRSQAVGLIVGQSTTSTSTTTPTTTTTTTP